MVFLDGPSLGEPREVWDAWLTELRAMDQQDESVQYAIRNTEITIRAMDESMP